MPKPQRSERLISFDDSDPTLAGSGRRPQPQMMGADSGNGSNNNSNTDLLGFDAVMSSNNKVMSSSSFSLVFFTSSSFSLPSTLVF